jgi:hypothetical protein
MLEEYKHSQTAASMARTSETQSQQCEHRFVT